MGRVLQQFDMPTQNELSQNVFITGGGSLFKGFAERVESELISLMPFRSPVKVWSANDSVLDAWRGAAYIARSDLAPVSVTRQTMEECGWDYLCEHSCSNIYVPTPQ